MQIGLIIYGSLDTVSGGYLYDRQLVSYLRSQGDKITVISLPWRNYARHLTDNGRWRWARALAAKQFDVLLQDELNHPSLFWINRRLRRRASFPIVSIVHHLRCLEPAPAGLRWFFRLVERRYLRQVDGFIYNGRDSRRAVAQLLQDKKPGVIAPPAADHHRPTIDHEGIQDRAQRAGPLSVLFAGTVSRRKDLGTLLRAVATLPAGTVRLDIAGSVTTEPAYAREMRALCRSLWPAGAPVSWHGLADQEALATLYRRCQLFVMPSLYEGFGIVYLEAMGYGMPAIGTTAGGASTTITQGRTGYLVMPGDVSALAARLSHLATDRDLLARLGQNARQDYLAQPGWAETGRLARDFLVDLTGGFR